MNDAIIKAAERALNPYFGPPATETRLLEVHAAANAFLAAVTPLIRNDALEEAARVAMDHPSGSYAVAAAIRTLKTSG